MMPGYTMPPTIVIYFLLLLFSRLIRFFRHFQRILPLFFHARELRFIFGFPLIFMACPKHPSIFNGLGREYQSYSQKLVGKIAFKIGQILIICCSFIHPNIFASSAIISCRDPLLFSIFWIFMSVNPHQL